MDVETYRNISSDSLIVTSERLMVFQRLGYRGLTEQERELLTLCSQVLQERGWFLVNDLLGYPQWHYRGGKSFH